MSKHFVSASAFLLGAVLFACEDENQQIQNVTIQFKAPSLEIVENGDEHVIEFSLSNTIAAASELSVKIEPANLVVTDPVAVNGVVTIPVAKGAVMTSFKLRAIANSTDQSDQKVNISIVKLPVPLVSGEQSTFVVTIKDDDEAPVPQSFADFINNGATIAENDQAGVEYVIQLSAPAATAGTIDVVVNPGRGVFARHFTSQPAVSNGKILLEIAQGQQTAKFRVYPIENTDATGQLDLVFGIAGTTGTIVRGLKTEEVLKIIDDELLGRPKGYTSANSMDSYKTLYEYDLQGRILKINWESHTPYKQTGADEYFYNNANRVVKIRKHAHKEIVYTWVADRIVKSEDVQDGVVKAYTDYGYDEAGNVALVAPHYLQPGGEFVRGMFFVYLYFNDGNVYKQLAYQPVDDPEGSEPVLISTKTYGNYIDVANPFPMVELLPGIKSQRKLAGTYVLEDNDRTETYQITYEFRADGQPSRRHVTGAGNNQTVEYLYY
jgi:hypothetical protein